METSKQVAVSPVNRLKQVMASPSVQEQFKNALAENSNLFVASLIDLYASDTYLQQCDPAQVVMEALKAATLKLPISKTLGFAYIVPYKKMGRQVPQFQLGYRGMVQLAQRSGIYRYINAGPVFEGEYRGFNKLTGDLDLTGAKTSDAVVGYFAYLETTNGFKKCAFATRDDMERHAKKYSKAFSRDSSPWQTEFDAMAEKTMLRKLLGKYGLLSIDMAEGLGGDNGGFDEDYRAGANGMALDMGEAHQPLIEAGVVDMETGEVTDHFVDANKMIDGEAEADPGQQEGQPTPPPFAV